MFLSPTRSLSVRGPDPVARSGGAYGASRIQGRTAYKHRGVDLVCDPWSDIVAPEQGFLWRIGLAYGREYRFHSLVVDLGIYEMKILYSWPIRNTGDQLQRGDALAIVEDLRIRYKEVTPHIHVEIRKDGKLVDPMPLLESE